MKKKLTRWQHACQNVLSHTPNHISRNVVPLNGCRMSHCECGAGRCCSAGCLESDWTSSPNLLQRFAASVNSGSFCCCFCACSEQQPHLPTTSLSVRYPSAFLWGACSRDCIIQRQKSSGKCLITVFMRDSLHWKVFENFSRLRNIWSKTYSTLCANDRFISCLSLLPLWKKSSNFLSTRCLMM